jgi:aspartate-semialdehyde dehydrogenase
MSVNVAVVGATGAVGQAMRDVLQEREFPVNRIKFLASERSAGRKISFRGEEYAIEELSDSSFAGVDIALFSIPKSMSLRYCPIAAAAGAVVVDNSNAWRMDPDVPLVVPEVNPQAIAERRKGIIANPNCSTIQMVVVLKPLHDFARIKRVVVTTFQAVGGTGREAMDELEAESRAVLAGEAPRPEVYPHQIAFNLLPEIPNKADWEANGYTEEEMKMHNETRKIMGDDSIQVTATCVRVPVFVSHSEAVNIETARKLTPEKARRLLSKAPGVKVVDDREKRTYPQPIQTAGQDDTWVGRIRQDYTVKRGLSLWVVADNVRKGAATNAVQIAEYLIK